MSSVACRSTAVAEPFGQPAARVLRSRAVSKSTTTVTELRCDGRNFGRTQPVPRTNAYLVALQLRAFPDHDLWLEGRHLRPLTVSGGRVAPGQRRGIYRFEHRDACRCGASWRISAPRSVPRQ